MASRKKAARPAAPAQSVATPARARDFTRRIVSDAGVDRCVELMTGGKWVRGASHVEVADEFGVSPETVKEWATSAGRIIRLCVEQDPEEIRARIIATLDTVVSKTIDDPKGARASVAALDLQARLNGILETKHRIDVTVQTFAALDDKSMLERVEQQIAELEDLRRKLLVKASVTVPALPAGGDDDG